jgi:hypothetical protein
MFSPMKHENKGNNQGSFNQFSNKENDPKWEIKESNIPREQNE